jgi:putative ubiquitin-RnfH superfamily antitoxin RatB of RatAB toxin-antitoxin module
MPFVNVPIGCTRDMASDTQHINIQVACATEVKQKVISLQVPEGTRLAEAVALSGIADEFPELDMSTSRMGIYGQVESPHRILAHSDRVEIYRPLLTNPRQARLNRAAVSKQNAAAAEQSKEHSD